MASSYQSHLRDELSRWKWFFFNQKYRFDLGQQFLTVINFSLLLITASDKLRYYTNIPRTWMLVTMAVPLGFCGVWLFGLFLDKVVRYGQASNLESLKRNTAWEEQQQMLMQIQKNVELIRKKLEATI